MGFQDDVKIQWFKRRVFGKEDPNKLLQWTCYILFSWSTLILVLMIALGCFATYAPADSSRFEGYEEFREMGSTFFFPYASFHLFSLISIALIYRMKRVGVLLYTIACVACIIFPWFKGFDFPPESLGFSALCVGLFAVHLGKMKKKGAKAEEKEITDYAREEQQ